MSATLPVIEDGFILLQQSDDLKIAIKVSKTRYLEQYDGKLFSTRDLTLHERMIVDVLFAVIENQTGVKDSSTAKTNYGQAVFASMLDTSPDSFVCHPPIRKIHRMISEGSGPVRVGHYIEVIQQLWINKLTGQEIWKDIPYCGKEPFVDNATDSGDQLPDSLISI